MKTYAEINPRIPRQFPWVQGRTINTSLLSHDILWIEYLLWIGSDTEFLADMNVSQDEFLEYSRMTPKFQKLENVVWTDMVTMKWYDYPAVVQAIYFDYIDTDKSFCHKYKIEVKKLNEYKSKYSFIKRINSNDITDAHKKLLDTKPALKAAFEYIEKVLQTTPDVMNLQEVQKITRSALAKQTLRVVAELERVTGEGIIDGSVMRDLTEQINVIGKVAQLAQISMPTDELSKHVQVIFDESLRKRREIEDKTGGKK